MIADRNKYVHPTVMPSSNIVDLLFIVFELQTKALNPNIDQWTMKIVSRSNNIRHLDMDIPQLLNTPHGVDILVLCMRNEPYHVTANLISDP